MTTNEWMTVAEVAEVLRCHPDTVRERIRDHSRRDAIPAELVSGSGHALRVHRSVAFPREQVVAVISDEQVDRALARMLARLAEFAAERRQVA
jgi:excisionase family DNA binding protein